MIAVKKVAFHLPVPAFIAILAVGAGIILTTGLLTGLVARPANSRCDTTLSSTTTAPTTTTRQVTTTTTTSVDGTVSGSPVTGTITAATNQPTTTMGTGTTTASQPTSAQTGTTRSTAPQTQTSTRLTSASSGAATSGAATSGAATGGATTSGAATISAATGGATTSGGGATSGATQQASSTVSGPTAPTTTSSAQPSSATSTGLATSLPTIEPSITPSLTTTTSTTTTTTETFYTCTSPTVANLTQYRLPLNIKPSEYNLLLKVNHNPYSSVAEAISPKALSYTGEVVIKIRATQDTNQIVLHMDRNVVPSEPPMVVNSITGQMIPVTSFAIANFQFYSIILSGCLQAGIDHDLTLKFSARTTRDGFYYHGYTEISQQQRSILGTRFIPNLARTAFPCFDEPNFKAIFTITIEHPSRSFALANSPIASSTTFDDNGVTKKRTIFSPSQPMSTYALGWAVVPDDFGNRTIKNAPGVNIDITIYGRESELSDNLGDFALEVAQKTLTYLRTALNAEALPPKLDLIALPYFPDFSSPSWGLNGFREFDLFFREAINSKADRQFTALTVAKEMAHIWFGNYITCEFWDDLWIQEGLAQLFQYRAINDAYPDWDIQNQFLVENTVPVLWRDGFESALPLRYEIDDSIELKYLFTDLLYKKSASLMRMFSNTYKDTFDAGITTLLTNFKFGTLNLDQFGASFQPPVGSPVTTKEYLEPWVRVENAPEVVVLFNTNATNTRVSFQQQRFLVSSIDLEVNNTETYLWPIYLDCVAGGTLGDPLGGTPYSFTYWLTQTFGEIVIPGRYDWIKCNKDFNGYYITEYGTRLFSSFETVLLNQPGTFSVADRVHIIHIAFELAWLGTHSYSVPSLIMVYMESLEDNLTPWRTLFFHVNKLAVITEHRTSFRNLRAFVGIQILDAINRIGFDLYVDSSNHTEELLKIEFLDQLGRLQNYQALNNFTNLFNSIDGSYFIDPENVPNALSSNLRSLAYKYHLQNTYNYQDWFTIYGFFEITNDEREREYAIDAMANTRLAWLFDLALDDLLFNPEEKIPIEYAPKLISGIGVNPSGRYLAWYFIREYWGDFFLRGTDMRKLSDATFLTCSSFDNLLLLEEVELFFYTTFDFENSDIRQRIPETVLDNFLWTIDREENFKTYFFEIPRFMNKI